MDFQGGKGRTGVVKPNYKAALDLRKLGEETRFPLATTGGEWCVRCNDQRNWAWSAVAHTLYFHPPGHIHTVQYIPTFRSLILLPPPLHTFTHSRTHTHAAPATPPANRNDTQPTRKLCTSPGTLGPRRPSSSPFDFRAQADLAALIDRLAAAPEAVERFERAGRVGHA